MSEQMFAKIEKIQLEIKSFDKIQAKEIEQFRIKFLGSKNILKPLMAEIRNVPPENRKEFGLRLNELKSIAEEKYNQLFEQSKSKKAKTEKKSLDLTVPPADLNVGARHPVSFVIDRIIEIFTKIGFQVAEDREIEDDWHNFTAMNTPEDHPARDMQDTFYLRDFDNLLLRTHTSSVQSRVMTKQKPPIRIIAPGRVFRNETISSRAHCQFHQIEGLYVDEGVSFAEMKKTLFYYAREMYGPDKKFRLRPSYFPFTEPSAEMDVYWGLLDEHAHRITKGTGWLEILGCGMVDPNVLENCGIDSTKYSGFAWGMGIERQAMQLYNITDIRLFFENDVRFLSQFKSNF